MRRGINLGNVLDVDPTVTAVLSVEESSLDLIAGAGLDLLRLPVRWTAHTARSKPFVIEESFAAVVDTAVGAALDRGLEVIVNVHHADDAMADPAGQEERFAAMWVQLGERYRGLADDVAFELLNEPRSPMTPEQWNRLLRVSLDAVRATNPTRRVLIGPAAMGTIVGLASLDLPADPHVVTTIHHYEPFRFTHQGVPWEAGSAEWIGTGWGTAEDGSRGATGTSLPISACSIPPAASGTWRCATPSSDADTPARAVAS